MGIFYCHTFFLSVRAVHEREREREHKRERQLLQPIFSAGIHIDTFYDIAEMILQASFCLTIIKKASLPI